MVTCTGHLKKFHVVSTWERVFSVVHTVVAHAITNGMRLSIDTVFVLKFTWDR